MLSVSGEVGGHVIWLRRQSRNQLRLISKRCANDFVQTTFLEELMNMIILRGERSCAEV